MTEKEVVTPAIFKPFLACPWMLLLPYSSPRQSSSRGPWF